LAVDISLVKINQSPPIKFRSGPISRIPELGKLAKKMKINLV
jgi:hypothetical protein